MVSLTLADLDFVLVFGRIGRRRRRLLLCNNEKEIESFQDQFRADHRSGLTVVESPQTAGSPAGRESVDCNHFHMQSVLIWDQLPIN